MKHIVFVIFFITYGFGQSNDVQNTTIKLDRRSFIAETEILSSPENFESGEKRLEAFFKFYGDYLKRKNPIWATQMGFYGHEGQWPKNALPYIKLSRLENISIQRVAETFDESTIKGNNKVYFNLLKENLESEIALVEMEMFHFPVNQQGYSPLGGNSHLTLISTITNHPTYSKKNMVNVFKLLDDVDKQVEEIIEILQAGLKKGYTTPKVTVADVPNQIKSVLTTEVEDNPFFIPFKQLKSFTREEIDGYQSKAKNIIREKIIPAYKKLYDFITKDYIPACREDIGISHLKDGEKKYNFLIQFYTTTRLTAKEIHQLGLSEVKRILSEMDKIKQQTGFKGDLHAFNDFLRTDPQFFHTDKEELLKDYRDICKRIDPELVRIFGKLPQLTYGVIPIPVYSEKSSTTAYYDYGSLAQGLPGYFYANTYKLETRPKWEMEALSLHEAVPGHHLQLALVQEITDQPDFIKFLEYTAFVEGWGLYSESLGSQLGMYKNPYSKYGQLTYEMWRAIRLVVDTGMHAFGWSRQQAIDYFKSNSAKTENDITVEIDRYIAWPGQALAYKIGELKFKELKAKAQQELGENFNIRAFHDLVLSQGSVPLSVLENMVNDWIKQQKKI